MRDVENWMSVLRGMSSNEAGTRLLGDLVGYRDASRWKSDDGIQAANFAEAWHRLQLEGEKK